MLTQIRTAFIWVLLLLAVIAYGQQPPAAAPTPPAGPRGPVAPPAGQPGQPGTGAADQPKLVDNPVEPPADPSKSEVSISFVKADLTNVLAFLSMASGVPIIVDAEVKGTVTITSLRKVPLPLAYEAINAALRVRGYTMVGTLQDKLIRVVTLKKAIAERVVVQEGADPTKIGTSDAMITQIIPLQFINAAKLKEEIKALVADDQASITAVSSANALVVTDTEGNVKRLVEIVNLLDKDTSDVLEFEVYQCKYSNATMMIRSLEKIFNITPMTPARPMPGQPPPQPGQPGVKMDDGGVLSLKGELHIAADDRTNCLIISATRPRIKLVLSLIEKLDKDTTSEVKAKVFPLKYADAKMVATQLTTLFEQPQGSQNRFPFYNPMPMMPQDSDYAGLKQNIIVADVRTNSVMVTATEQNLKEFEALIKELDAPNVLSDIARTFQLKYAKASVVAQTLNNLFRGNTRRFSFFDLFYGGGGNNDNSGDPISSLKNITVVPEEKTNTLLVTGSPQSFPMVENIIAQLDRRTVQVFIEVAIVDVTLDNTNKFGLEWTWNSDEKGPDGTTPHDTVGTSFDLDKEKIGLRYSLISDNLKVLLHALATRSNVKVYSTPSITTADNIPASISIGQDIPFVSSSEETTGGHFRQTVDFKNVSIALNVTPHVTEASDLIALDVQQTINELIGREIELNAPIIANRQAKTTVMVNDGQTIVIGGIIKENSERQTKSVPLLGDIPVIGELFKSRSNVKQKSELMVFLTPHILRTEESVKATTDQERSKLSDPGNVLDGTKLDTTKVDDTKQDEPKK